MPAAIARQALKGAETRFGIKAGRRTMSGLMIVSILYLLLCRLLRLVARSSSEASRDVEIAVLRHQLKVLRRQVARPRLRWRDRAFLAAAARVIPRKRWTSLLVTPQTVLRWHRDLIRRRWTYRRPRKAGLRSTRRHGNSCFAWPERTLGGATSAFRAS